MAGNAHSFLLQLNCDMVRFVEHLLTTLGNQALHPLWEGLIWFGYG